MNSLFKKKFCRWLYYHFAVSLPVSHRYHLIGRFAKYLRYNLCRGIFEYCGITVVLYKEYRYIYNKIDCSEELYDIGWDPNQNFNLISDNSYDIDRHVDIRSQELYFYPYWDKLPEIRAFLREKRKSIWREPTKKQVLVSRIRKNRLVRKLAMPIIKLLRKKRQTKNSF